MVLTAVKPLGPGRAAVRANLRLNRVIKRVSSLSYRDVPDVAFDADPNSGVAVCCKGAWGVVGGTSLSAPCWAGLFTLGGLNGVSSVYSQASTSGLYSSNYHDITTGSNGFSAGTGYDVVTGLESQGKQHRTRRC